MERSHSSEGVEGTLLSRWERIYLVVDKLVFILNLFQFSGMVYLWNPKKNSNLNLLQIFWESKRVLNLNSYVLVISNLIY